MASEENVTSSGGSNAQTELGEDGFLHNLPWTGTRYNVTNTH